MELKSGKLENLLNTELVGKDVGYTYWNFSSAVIKLIRIIAKDAGLNENDFSYEQAGGSHNSIYLRYKKVSFGEASFQKQKGRYHYGSYEWTFKKCFVSFWNEYGYSRFKGLTFQEMLDAIDKELVDQADSEAKKLAQAKEIFEMIKTKLNVDDYGARQFVDYLNKNKYSISN